MGVRTEGEIRPRNRLGIKDIARITLATQPRLSDPSKEISGDLPLTNTQSIMGTLLGRAAIGGILIKENAGPNEDYTEHLQVGLKNGDAQYKLTFTSTHGNNIASLELYADEISETPRSANGKRFQDRKSTAYPYVEETPMELEGAFGGKFTRGAEFESFAKDLIEAKIDRELTQQMLDEAQNGPSGFGLEDYLPNAKYRRTVEWMRPQ